MEDVSIKENTRIMSPIVGEYLQSARIDKSPEIKHDILHTTKLPSELHLDTLQLPSPKSCTVN